MKHLLSTSILLAGVVVTSAASTINSTNKHAYGANIGWLNAEGATIGEYVCAGYVWGANVGWILLGDGTPANSIRYLNDSPTDSGVNHDGLGNLRGYAYGANIGWINFESNGAPRVDLKTGALSGHVYSANCGWISLSNTFAHVQTDFLLPGADTDGDGITDAWELSHTNTLTALSAATDADGDGVSDLDEHLADTSPLDPADYLRVTFYSVAQGTSETNTLIWLSTLTRCYQVDYRTNLNAGSPWADATGVFAPDSGAETTHILALTPVLSERYFRVKAIKPLSP